MMLKLSRLVAVAVGFAVHIQPAAGHGVEVAPPSRPRRYPRSDSRRVLRYRVPTAGLAVGQGERLGVLAYQPRQCRRGRGGAGHQHLSSSSR